jgi:hypothetical protein
MWLRNSSSQVKPSHTLHMNLKPISLSLLPSYPLVDIPNGLFSLRVKVKVKFTLEQTTKVQRGEEV